MRILELYCGIGGCAAAVGDAAEIAAAVDVSRVALEVYRHNFRHPAVAKALESTRLQELLAWDADLWWLSPPCQPYTRRGLRRDDEDPRARSLVTLAGVLERLGEAGPQGLGLENVPEFGGSRTHARLRQALERGGYEVAERVLCPSQLGLPNRRRRFYLAASRRGLGAWPEPGPGMRPTAARPLADFLDPEPDSRLEISQEVQRRYDGALHTVSAEDPAAVTACFTSAYGRSPVRSGSYLEVPGGLRRFSPAEVLRLLGFPPRYTLPPEMPPGRAWRLVGNSLSLPPVRQVLRVLGL